MLSSPELDRLLSLLKETAQQKALLGGILGIVLGVEEGSGLGRKNAGLPCPSGSVVLSEFGHTSPGCSQRNSCLICAHMCLLIFFGTLSSSQAAS